MSERFANSVSLDQKREGAGAVERTWSWGPGEKIGTYVLEARIGAGGMGEVWRARSETGLPVAVKLALRPEARDALRRQGAAQRKLFHTSIARVLDEDLTHEPPYVVFELIEGRNLRAVLEELALVRVSEMVPRWKVREGDGVDPAEANDRARVNVVRSRPLTPAERTERLAPIIRQVASGLAHAHGCGIVHGDLKPENVLLAEDGRALLTDFGLGTTAAGAEVALSRSLATTSLGGGTLAYLAPERHTGAPPTAEGDVWSFGIMLFEACHGRFPQGFERPHGWPLEPVFAGCYVPAGERLRTGAEVASAVGRTLAPPRQGTRQARVTHAPGGRRVSPPARRFSGAERLGIAACLFVAMGVAKSWAEGAGWELRPWQSRLEASVEESPREARARLDRKFEESLRGRDVRLLLARVQQLVEKEREGRSGLAGVSPEWASFQAEGETLGFRLVPDAVTGAIVAYPRHDDWPVLRAPPTALGLARAPAGGRIR